MTLQVWVSAADTYQIGIFDRGIFMTTHQMATMEVQARLPLAVTAIAALAIVAVASGVALSHQALGGAANPFLLGTYFAGFLAVPAGWLAAVTAVARAGRVGARRFGALVVPIALLVSLLVLMTDAVLWQNRGDGAAYLAVLFVASFGPASYLALVVMAVRTRLGAPIAGI